MREMVMKNLISEDKLRRELFVSERTEGKNLVQDLEKKSTYVIKEILDVTQDCDLQLFLQQKKTQGLFKPAKTFIVRIQDSKEGKVKFVYKVLGDQYIVVKDRIFLLGVTQYLKIEMEHTGKSVVP